MPGQLSPSMLRVHNEESGKPIDEPDENDTLSRQSLLDDLLPLGRGGTKRGFGQSARRRVVSTITNSHVRPQVTRPPQTLSPSVLGGTEEALPESQSEPIVLQPNNRVSASSSCTRAGNNRAPAPSQVPSMPFQRRSASGTAPQLLDSVSGIGMDEAYSIDEKQLNEFIRLHPMLSMEACSRKTLQIVANAFDKAAIRVPDVPVVPKSHDDSYLRAANPQIGERSCISGDNCLCAHMARLKHGADTDLAFIGTEFLLPSERTLFLAGNGLPTRRKKCLVCTRYWQNYIYIQARTDPNFKLSSAPIAMQAFGNTVGPPLPVATSGDSTPPDLVELGRSMTELPINSSIVHATDGYKPEAMLFVDEEFASNSRAAREGSLSAMMWKPVVRFSSAHYRYVKGRDGPHIIQVGIGADDPTGTGLGFVQPAAAKAAPPSA
jgi:hypothetical protein